MKLKVFFIVFVIITFACSNNKKSQFDFPELKNELSSQLKILAQSIPDDQVPRSFPDTEGKLRMVGINDWTCGFPAGSFWLMYELTGDEYWKTVAEENTVKLDGVQFRTNSHDLGFMVFCSYGNGYRLTKNEEYKKVILQASESLLTRFNPKVGCIKSWDWGTWQYPVIIDNMMNLEMLFWASEQTGDPKYKEVAITHADKTLENHFRDNMSSYHVVDYDTLTGNAIAKVTHQGLNDESAWGRGQAWGLYGFTVMFRETGDTKYLEAASQIADFILANLPEDKVSYWDFDSPDIPNTYRDVSAAAITASALLELATFNVDSKNTYSETANTIIKSLTSKKYKAEYGTNGGFLLMHSVGHKPKNSEVDVAINYTDYYYLEALKRQGKILK